MTGGASQPDVRREMQRLDALLDEVDAQADPAVRVKTNEALSAVLQFHGAALAVLLERVAACGDRGRELMAALGEDELVGQMLLLHGLHPLDLTERVNRALEKVRPYLASHGGHVELIGVSPAGEVALRLEGSCHGCPSSRVTLKQTIEEAIYAAAPDVAGLRVEGAVAEEEPAPPLPEGFVPVSQLSIHSRRLGTIEQERSSHGPLHATA